MDNKCLFDKGNRCYVLNKKECEKCRFFKENTAENEVKYIDKVKEEIKKYAETHKQEGTKNVLENINSL